MTLGQVLLVALGGAIGASLRFACMGICSYFKFFPLATILVNALGSALLIAVIALKLDSVYVLFFAVGIASSLSTLSSICNDLYMLIIHKTYLKAIIYLCLNISFSFFTIYLVINYLKVQNLL